MYSAGSEACKHSTLTTSLSSVITSTTEFFKSLKHSRGVFADGFPCSGIFSLPWVERRQTCGACWLVSWIFHWQPSDWYSKCDFSCKASGHDAQSCGSLTLVGWRHKSASSKDENEFLMCRDSWRCFHGTNSPSGFFFFVFPGFYINKIASCCACEVVCGKTAET